MPLPQPRQPLADPEEADAERTDPEGADWMEVVEDLSEYRYNNIIQVNKNFCELKRGNIGIVEKAQGTRFGMSPKYSRYIGIAS